MADKWGDVEARELQLSEDMRSCEFFPLVPAMTAKEAAVRVLWGDGAEQQPYQVTDPELTQQGEGSVSSREKQAHSPAPSEEVPSAGTQSPVSAPDSPCCPPSPSRSPLGAQTPREQLEEAEQGSLLAEEENEDGSSDWEYCSQTELSEDRQGEVEQEPSQGEFSSSQDLSSWDDCSEPELRDLRDSVEEDSTITDLPQDCSDHLSVFSFGPTPLLWEEEDEADWDEISVLEMYEAEGRAQRLPDPAADELPAPQEVWFERQAPEFLYGSFPSLYSEASVGQQGPEAGPQSPRGAPAPQPGAQARRQQPPAPSKRPGRLRRALRALRALLCWPCLARQLQE